MKCNSVLHTKLFQNCSVNLSIVTSEEKDQDVVFYIYFETHLKTVRISARKMTASHIQTEVQQISKRHQQSQKTLDNHQMQDMA